MSAKLTTAKSGFSSPLKSAVVTDMGVFRRWRDRRGGGKCAVSVAEQHAQSPVAAVGDGQIKLAVAVKVANGDGIGAVSDAGAIAGDRRKSPLAVPIRILTLFSVSLITTRSAMPSPLKSPIAIDTWSDTESFPTEVSVPKVDVKPLFRSQEHVEHEVAGVGDGHVEFAVVIEVVQHDGSGNRDKAKVPLPRGQTCLSPSPEQDDQIAGPPLADGQVELLEITVEVAGGDTDGIALTAEVTGEPEPAVDDPSPEPSRIVTASTPKSAHRQVELSVPVEVAHRDGIRTVPDGNRCAGAEVKEPSPFPSSTLTVLPARLATTKSGTPSPLKSPVVS